MLYLRYRRCHGSPVDKFRKEHEDDSRNVVLVMSAVVACFGALYGGATDLARCSIQQAPSPRLQQKGREHW